VSKAIFLAALLLLGLAGCKVDVADMKNKQQKRASNAGKNVREQTGTDLGTAKPDPNKRKFRLPTAPVDP
jgi:uncharacterized lipoprotein